MIIAPTAVQRWIEREKTMREILFRGKRTDNGEWVKGDLIHRKVWGHEVIIIRVSDGGFDCYEEYEVIPETVGQYTGLKDKNGKKIFEGDIVRLTDEHNEMEWTAVVVFGNPNGDYNWGWQLNAIEEFDGNKDILLWADMEESGAYCEIIGNVHDNQELMEGGE